MSRRLLVAAGLGAALGGAGLAWWQWQGAAMPTGADALGDDFWRLRFRSAAGGEVGLAQFQGRPLLINFWATWCAPCVREMPALDRFHQQWSPRGWSVLGLAVDQIAPVLVFSQKLKVSYPLLVTEGEGLMLSQRLGNPGGLPYTLLADAQGHIRQRKAGETTLEELSAWAAAI